MVETIALGSHILLPTIKIVGYGWQKYDFNGIK